MFGCTKRFFECPVKLLCPVPLSVNGIKGCTKGFFERRLAEKAHPNIYEAVTLFQSKQAATEVSIMQMAAGGLPIHRRRKYRNYEKRLVTIREKFAAGDYSLSELVKACSHWVSL